MPQRSFCFSHNRKIFSNGAINKYSINLQLEGSQLVPLTVVSLKITIKLLNYTIDFVGLCYKIRK